MDRETGVEPANRELEEFVHSNIRAGCFFRDGDNAPRHDYI